MKVIVAGSRGINDYRLVCFAMEKCGFHITEIVSGTARGVDLLGERWATHKGIPIKRFSPEWRPLGIYNPRAGHERNTKMAEYGDALVAIWDGTSTGTNDMINQMSDRHKPVFVLKVHGLKNNEWQVSTRHINSLHHASNG